MRVGARCHVGMPSVPCGSNHNAAPGSQAYAQAVITDRAIGIELRWRDRDAAGWQSITTVDWLSRVSPPEVSFSCLFGGLVALDIERPCTSVPEHGQSVWSHTLRNMLLVARSPAWARHSS